LKGFLWCQLNINPCIFFYRISLYGGYKHSHELQSIFYGQICSRLT
jgi:hypothetical protein